MIFTPEQLAKAKKAKSAEELLALAKENGIELTEEEAAKYFADLHKEGELSDDELDNVSGGGCGGGPLYYEGQKFNVDGGVLTILSDAQLRTDSTGSAYYVYNTCLERDIPVNSYRVESQITNLIS